MRALGLLAIGAGLMSPAAAQAQSYGIATYTAQIGSAGPVKLSNGLQSATKPGTGSYELTFTRDISTCVAVASTINIPGIASVIYKAGSPTVIDVTTTTVTGSPVDRGFNIIVSCGP